ncbi:MAG: SAM-dependent methyltransferase [Verrucomicrobiae bacterium]|nr:SAM-dependent methyltransferase [Verrucomicrobiae bacterium]
MKTEMIEEIRRSGPVSFARFMEWALYHPDRGYYARRGAERQVGRRGDFFTSVSVGALFGRLLARQFASWWIEMKRPAPFHLVECGGLDGRLAADVLAAMAGDAPECAAAIQYTLIEPLPSMVAAQQQRLNGMTGVSWAASLRDMPPRQGILFGNELLDAFPVHRLEKDAQGWNEWKVAEKDEKLVWRREKAVPGLFSGLPAGAEGQVEVCPAAAEWLCEAGRVIVSGRICLLDYGWTDEECFQMPHAGGTLRAYRQHALSEDLLAFPGEQDLTAHVRWSPLLRLAVAEGWSVSEFVQQGRWLGGIFARQPFDLSPAEMRQFKTLIHPDIMGSAFRTLVLSR